MLSTLLIASSALLTTEALRVGTMSKTTAGAMIPETCTANIQRLSGAVNRGDYAKHQGDTTKYTDPDFPPNESSLFWSGHPWDVAMPATYVQKVTGWARPSELTKAPSLWGSQGVRPAGTRQGALGDCWLLASAAALAEHPERIKKLFTNRSYSKAGIFELTFFHMGEPVKEVVDDLIPITAGRVPINTQPSKAGAWWQVILEKGYSKFNVNYAQLNFGQPSLALRELTGMPTRTYWAKDIHVLTDQALFDIVADADRREWAVVSSTLTAYHGLVVGHAYSVLGAIQLQGGPQLFKVRNPWGRETYTGPFSDASNLWTAAWKAQAGLVVADDGIFYIPVSAFKPNFGDLSVCMYQNWHHESVRVTGTGKTFWKTLTSPVDQKVVVTLDYQTARGVPKKCAKKYTPSLWYNIYVLENNVYGPAHSINPDMSFGMFTLNAKAGVTYKLAIINYKDATVNSNFMLGAYGDQAAAQWG